jgi:hypothetical protein
MAYNLSKLPSLVSWLLLVFLTIWDLVAVLCPFGPLRVMLESAQANNQDLPAAMLYTGIVHLNKVGMAYIDKKSIIIPTQGVNHQREPENINNSSPIISPQSSDDVNSSVSRSNISKRNSVMNYVIMR